MSLARDSHSRRASIVLALLAATAALTFVGSSARATVMVELSLDRLIRDSHAIVWARVLENGVRLDMSSGGAAPETITRLQVREWLAGPGGETVTLRELGGVWQGGGLRFAGTPRYAPGEEVVVFLERRPEAPHDLRTLGMVQGKFVVRHGVPGVPSSVRRDLEGIAFARWANGQQTVEHAGEEPAMELQTFLDYIRRVRGGPVIEPEGPLRGGALHEGSR